MAHNDGTHVWLHVVPPTHRGREPIAARDEPCEGPADWEQQPITDAEASLAAHVLLSGR